jgi:hypothetical protein
MATIHSSIDYTIRPQGDPPPGYPSKEVQDFFQSAPSGSTFDQRRAEFIDHVMKNPAPQNTKSVWYELIRVVGGGLPHEGVIRAACDFVDARRDCSDFVLHSILRMLYQFGKQEMGRVKHYPSFSDPLLASAKQTILNFKYFPDEPGSDSLCTWTENHYILFTSAAFLAGQLYPDTVFTNSGQTGRQKVALNRTRILRWLELRFRTGFSEWLSHVYYDEDLTALLSLYDFVEDEEIRRKSEMVLDLLLLDMALNAFKGVFGSTHGRSYERTKKWASNEDTVDTFKLLFGMGVYSGIDNMSAPAFALSEYGVPVVLEVIAQDATRTIENRQRMGIKLAEMEDWGIRPDNFEDGMLYLTLEAYLHPCTVENTIRMFDVCNWWENDFLKEFKEYKWLLTLLRKTRLLPHFVRPLQRDICRNTREEVNIYTYRTPDYMLSTAQDYCKGFGGDQQHIWQATLGPEAVCFTTHPAKIEGLTPNYWTGSGLLPRTAQYKNLAITIYKIEKILALYVPIRHFFTHAWLPKGKFDEVIEKSGWIFARKEEGYLGLYSMQSYIWGTYKPCPEDEQIELRESTEEIIADGAQNIWICQMGRKAEDGSFAAFVQKTSAAEITFKGLNVEFQSPGIGLVCFGWESPLSVDGVEIPLHDYLRYDNPFVRAEFPSDEIQVAAGELELYLNWRTGERR